MMGLQGQIGVYLRLSLYDMILRPHSEGGVIVWLDPNLEFNGRKMGPAIILTPVKEMRPTDKRVLPTFLLHEGGSDDQNVKENLAGVAEQVANLVNITA
jgi:hypothetical protein